MFIVPNDPCIHDPRRAPFAVGIDGPKVDVADDNEEDQDGAQTADHSLELGIKVASAVPLPL